MGSRTGLNSEQILGMTAKLREKKMLLIGCTLHRTYIYYLCVITGNIQLPGVPKLGHKDLFGTNLKKNIFLIRRTKLKNFRLGVREK